MNIRQITALIVTLVVLGLAAAGLSYLGSRLAPPVPPASSETTFESQVRSALHLSEDAYLSLEAEERDFYVLGVYPNGVEAGGGYIAIVKDTGTGAEVIAQGQEAPTCEAVDGANVPVELITHCMTDQGELIERALD